MSPQDGSGDGIYGQRYAADGSPVGSEFRVNTYTSNEENYPSVTALHDGGFVVTWSAFGKDGGGLYGQRYAADGTPVGSEFRVNTYTNDNQHASVTALHDGGFVMTWSGVGGDSGGYSNIYGQCYAADGSPVGSEFRANTYTSKNQVYSSATALGDGGFVVTWSSDGQDGIGYGIYGQRYAADGTPVGSEFAINQITASDQIGHYASEHTASSADGHLVQVWTGSGQEGGLFFRLIDVPSANTPPTVMISSKGGLTNLATPTIAGTVASPTLAAP